MRMDTATQSAIHTVYNNMPSFTFAPHLLSASATTTAASTSRAHFDIIAEVMLNNIGRPPMAQSISNTSSTPLEDAFHIIAEVKFKNKGRPTITHLF